MATDQISDAAIREGGGALNNPTTDGGVPPKSRGDQKFAHAAAPFFLVADAALPKFEKRENLVGRAGVWGVPL